MYDQIINGLPEVLKAAAGAALALIAAALLRALKARLYGGWRVEVKVGEVVMDTDPISAKDGEVVLEFARPWWWVLLFGGAPTLRHEREVRQLLQSEVTPFGNVSGDVRDFTMVDADRRMLVINLTEGTNFEPRPVKKPAPKPATPTT